MMTRDRLLEILQSLPAVRLELIGLTWKLVDDNGRIDEAKVAFYYVEVEKAVIPLLKQPRHEEGQVCRPGKIVFRWKVQIRIRVAGVQYFKHPGEGTRLLQALE